MKKKGDKPSLNGLGVLQNDSSNFILSTLTNEYLRASYVRLVIFLSISFKYYYHYFYKDCIFLKYPIFHFLGGEMWRKK
jgi:hypothetical protein